MNNFTTNEEKYGKDQNIKSTDNDDNNEYSVVVSALDTNGMMHPYTSIALAPNRQRAFLAGKDTLRLVSICPYNGLKEIRSFSVSQVSILDFFLLNILQVLKKRMILLKGSYNHALILYRSNSNLSILILFN